MPLNARQGDRGSGLVTFGYFMCLLRLALREVDTLQNKANETSSDAATAGSSNQPQRKLKRSRKKGLRSKLRAPIPTPIEVHAYTYTYDAQTVPESLSPRSQTKKFTAKNNGAVPTRPARALASCQHNLRVVHEQLRQWQEKQHRSPRRRKKGKAGLGNADFRVGGRIERLLSEKQKLENRIEGLRWETIYLCIYSRIQYLKKI